MQMRLLDPTKATCAIACLGMSVWVACDNDSAIGRAKSAIEGDAAVSAGTGAEEPPATGGGTGGDGDESGSGGSPSGGTGGTPAGGTGGMPESGTGGTGVDGGSGTGGTGAGTGGTGGVGGAGTGGAGGGGMGGAGGGGMGGVAGDDDGGVVAGSPGGHRHGKRSTPPPYNNQPSPPAAVGGGGGCGTSLTIRFKAVVGAHDFACGESYPGQGSENTTVTPQDFRFFVQDLALIRSDGKHVPVNIDVRAPWQSKTVALVDFEDHTGACTAGNMETNAEITGAVPAGSYTGLSFTTGVPEDLNHADIVTLIDPLQRYKDLSSGPPTGFRFLVAELLQEPDEGTGRGVFHLGSTECSGDPVTCAKPNRNHIVLDHFNVCTDVVLADIGEIFAYTHLAQPTVCTPDGQYCAPMFEAAGVEYETGLPLPPPEVQTVFRKQ